MIKSKRAYVAPEKDDGIRELKSKKAQLEVLNQKAAEGPVTLVYGAKDELHNEAVVLQRKLLAKRVTGSTSRA